MVKHLVCTCGDCKHWEILTNDPKYSFLEALARALPLNHVLRCVTCGTEHTVTLHLKPHDTFKEVEVTE